MKKSTNYSRKSSPKKVYQTPKLKVLGSVKKLTLKVGSAIDSFGTGDFTG